MRLTSARPTSLLSRRSWEEASYREKLAALASGLAATWGEWVEGVSDTNQHYETESRFKYGSK